MLAKNVQVHSDFSCKGTLLLHLLCTGVEAHLNDFLQAVSQESRLFAPSLHSVGVFADRRVMHTFPTGVNH